MLGVLLSVSHGRTWTSTAGSTIEAELVSHEGGEVCLKTPAGKTVKLKLSQLAAPDQDYILSLEKKSESEEAPKKKARRGRRVLPDWENWDEDWPKMVKTSQDFEIEHLEADESQPTHPYVYSSPHFIFYSDAELTKSLVKKFSWYFESSHAMMQALPLSLARTQEEEKHKIVLFESASDYYKNGGPKGSAGVYIGGKDVVLVPFGSVGMKKSGSRYTVDHDADNKTLSHEIVHSYTDWPYYQSGARGWFTEGIAEYVGVTYYRSGIFMPSKTACLLYTSPSPRDA